jgi:carboxypeptidase C (cathepsin A)
MADEKEPKKDDEKKKKDLPPPEDKVVETEHKVTINGKVIEYTVHTGRLVLKEEDKDEGEKAKAQIFFVAYTKKGEKDAAQRPVTFSFNGGPGSASVWLHLGLFGPRRVKMQEPDGWLPPPPYELVDNEFSL